MSSGKMCPNTMFKHIYPALWNEYYEDKAKLYNVLYPGLYALVLGLVRNNGLYDNLIKAYGAVNANAFLDYSMYSILEHSNVISGLQDSLRQYVTFSDTPHSDAWMSNFFSSAISEEDNIDFKNYWIANCKNKGITKCWISIDGSNTDCKSQQSELVEKGHAKSAKDNSIVSYMYAVSATDGTPITYCVYNGSKIDSQAFQKIVALLKKHDLEIEGVILDRGFCTKGVLNSISDLGYDYIVMLKSDTFGHKMMMKHSEEIRWKTSHLVNVRGLFGIKGEEQIFEDSTHKSNIHLFFDASNATGRSLKLIKNISYSIEVIKEQLKSGTITYEIPNSLKKFIDIVEDNDGKQSLQINYEEWDKAINIKGFSSIACSNSNLSSSNVDKIYHSRDVSEKLFSFIKTQEGFESLRVHNTSSILNKSAACFIASIIRTEIEDIAKRLEIPTNSVLSEVDRTTLSLQKNDLYISVKDYSKKLRDILKQAGLETNCFDAISTEINYLRKDNNQSQERYIETEQDKIIEIPSVIENIEAPTPKRGKGRPKGSRNKTTIEKERHDLELGVVKEKRAPGRPKGAKNKKTLARERLIQEGKIIIEKRAPGRPKGAKNKPKVVKIKRGPGRPKGSKNKIQ